MKRLLTIQMALTLSCMAAWPAVAQTDSSRIDAGTLEFRKEFTQTITIKGEDLEKMPFTDLSEAINAWLLGAYSNASTLSYVVDGNFVTDVNAYSVYDIKEVTFVMNAAADINSASSPQRLVVITTRRPAKGKSLRLAGQSGLVNRNYNDLLQQKGLSSYTNWYHQYYAGGNIQTGKVDMGLSADWLRDVMPARKTPPTSVGTPFELNRFRLNGYFTFKAGARNELGLAINYTPQHMDSVSTNPANSYTSYPYNNFHEHQHLFMPSIFWKSHLLPGLQNDLRVAYLSLTDTVTSVIGNVDKVSLVIDTSYGTSYLLSGLMHSTTQRIYVRDRLWYDWRPGHWVIEPSINAYYDHTKDNYRVTTGEYYGGAAYNYSYYYLDYGKNHAGTVTPSLDISYGPYLDIKGGFQTLFAHSFYLSSFTRGTYPFISASGQVASWGKDKRKSDIMLFGSYAKLFVFYLNDYALNDLTGAAVSYNIFGNNSNVSGVGVPVVGYAQYSTPFTYWSWQAGLRLRLAGDRLVFQYNFEKRNYITQAEQLYYTGGGFAFYSVYNTMQSSTHLLSLTAKILDRPDWQWQSGLTAVTMRTKAKATVYEYIDFPPGDLDTTHTSWTGGWVNRLRFRHFLAGLDLAYHFNARSFAEGSTIQPLYYDTVKSNSLLLQNVYIGYRVREKGRKTFDLYIQGRNIAESSHSYLSDRRRYYGLGASLTF